MELILALVIIMAISGIVAINAIESNIAKAKEENRDPQYWWEN